MPSPDKNVFEDQYLVRYLVGALPAEEVDRLDQLSVVDDDFAWRLREIENDLVDSYVRSELNGETLARFKAFYMATSQRRQKVQFAEGLRQLKATNGAAQTAGKISHQGSFLGHVFVVTDRAANRHRLCCVCNVADSRILAGAERAPASRREGCSRAIRIQ